MVLASITSVQVGSALSKGLFSTAHPITVSFLRLASGALMLLIFARPRLRGRTRSDWLALLGFATALITMNISIYFAFEQIPVGVGVTIEFLGPLAVAVAGSRRARDLVWALLAATGVALLGLQPGSLTWLGVGFALLAGAAWAGYILTSQRLGRTWRPADAVALSCLAGAAVTAIPGIAVGGPALLDPRVVGIGVLVGLLSTVLPYTLEMRALQHLPTSVFGILMSLEPAVAALAGLLVLGQRLDGIQLVGMALVVAASVAVLGTVGGDGATDVAEATGGG